jgi:Ca-activated chloride channel family protein
MARPTVRLTLGLDVAALSTGKDTTAHLVCELEGLEQGVESARPPLTVMLLLDVSGSMSGPPIEAVSTSVRKLLALLDPMDRVGLAAFSDSASVLAPPTPLDAATRQVLLRVRRRSRTRPRSTDGASGTRRTGSRTAT